MTHRSFLLLIIYAMTTLSCNREKEELDPVTSFPQIFELVAIFGSIANQPPLTGDDLEFSESYRLNANGTFIKIRQRPGEESLRAEGSYSKEIDSEGNEVLKLVYNTMDNSLIENCGVSNEEWLRLENNGHSLFGGSQACDGPRLEYTLIR